SRLPVVESIGTSFDQYCEFEATASLGPRASRPQIDTKANTNR
ncbi:MAG: hypothetical protein, partial [Olavius algarvensis Gamma 1 endosymbiont]